MNGRPVTVGDLFRPDDEIGQWVFALSAATEDLALAESVFRRELDADAEPQVVGYYFRHLVARIYEAERPILALEQHAEARAFAESLPGAQAALSFLRSAYIARPGARSRVRETFGDVRHLSVHHSWVGSDELREALHLGADEEARIIVNRAKETLRHEWPEAVVGRYLLGDLTGEERRRTVAADGRFAGEILNSFARLLMRARDAHFARVGIDGCGWCAKSVDAAATLAAAARTWSFSWGWSGWRNRPADTSSAKPIEASHSGRGSCEKATCTLAGNSRSNRCNSCWPPAFSSNANVQVSR